MTEFVKTEVKKYLESIGGIKTVKKKYRIALLKRCIQFLTLAEKENFYEKFTVWYPMFGTTEPMRFNFKEPKTETNNPNP
jgi:hypothetical protein